MDPLLSPEGLDGLPLLLAPDGLDAWEKDDDSEFAVLEPLRLLEPPESPELDAETLEDESTELPDDDIREDDAVEDPTEDADDDDDGSDDETLVPLRLDEPVDDSELVEDELNKLETAEELVAEAEEEPVALDPDDETSDT